MMTALDQAIIKAFLRQGGLPPLDEAESDDPVCSDVAGEEAVRVDAPESNRSPATRPASVPFEVLEVTETGFPVDVDRLMEGPGLGPGLGLVRPANAERAPDPPASQVSPHTGEGKPAGTDFEPMLRVDAISWPRPTRRLRLVAEKQIERLADAIREPAASGGKLVGMAAFTHGEGCSTVLLAAALRLVELGQRTLVLDGDIVDPKLAEHLALVNDVGWYDVAIGLIPLEDAVAQSESESLAVLPYRGEATPVDGPEPSQAAITDLLNQIRRHYDVTLVDLGGALTCGGSEGALADKLVQQIDSVLAVQNVQTTSPARLALLRKHFRRLGVEETGIIENFVDP